MDGTENSHIVSTPGYRGGRPRISGTRITVQDIVLMHLRLGEPLEKIVSDYQLQPAAVHAALSYYYDHQAEIDKMMADDETYVEEMKRKTPSLLKQRLQAQGRESTNTIPS
jgi:uncharacterized protein (DUF433 family)